MPPRTPHDPPHASHAHPRSQVQDGPINQRWAANIQDESLSGVVSDLSDIADIDVRNQVQRRGSNTHAAGSPCEPASHPLEIDARPQRSIITLIANVAQSSNVMLVVFQVMQKLGVQVEMISQGASKVSHQRSQELSSA